MMAGATALTTLPSQQMSHKSMVGMAIPRGFPRHWTNNYDLSTMTGLTTWKSSNGGASAISNMIGLETVKLPFKLANNSALIKVLSMVVQN